MHAQAIIHGPLAPTFFLRNRRSEICTIALCSVVSTCSVGGLKEANLSAHVCMRCYLVDDIVWIASTVLTSDAAEPFCSLC
jgi:hypothetical protein